MSSIKTKRVEYNIALVLCICYTCADPEKGWGHDNSFKKYYQLNLGPSTYAILHRFEFCTLTGIVTTN